MKKVSRRDFLLKGGHDDYIGNVDTSEHDGEDKSVMIIQEGTPISIHILCA